MIQLPDNKKLFDFQIEASTWLLDNTIDNEEKRTLIIKSPTGSGKTIILLDYIDKYLDYSLENTSFIWLSIGTAELEEQSKLKAEKYLPQIKTKTLLDAINDGFDTGDVTFINWEAINKSTNKSMKFGEIKNVIDRITEAHKKGINFIVIIDEEHRNNTTISNELLSYFSANSTIRVSATPIKNDSALVHEIPESSVIMSGLITSGMSVNENISDLKLNMETEYEYLIDTANAKRIQIAEEYRKLNKDIRPLVIIQFPDSSNDYINEVEEILDKLGYSYNNGMVAKWLSEEKINIDNIEKNNAQPIFLLWKQALSTGWDCPRAKILVKLRNNMSDSFEIQTIGRIRRMPEAKHYNNEILDYCYMYTFDEEWKEKVLQDTNSFELKTLLLKKDMKDFKLTKEVRDPSVNDYGEREIREIIFNYLVDKYNLETSSSKSSKESNKNILMSDSWIFSTDVTRTFVKGKFSQLAELTKLHNNQYQQYKREINTHIHGRDVMNIINELHKIISIDDQSVRSILKTLFHEQQANRINNLLSLENKEWYAFIINNREVLKSLFREIKAESLYKNNRHQQLELGIEDVNKFYKEKEFKLPLSDYFKVDTLRRDLENDIFDKNVYSNYQKNMVTDKTRSTVEQKFEYYCDLNENLEWIYKNGDKGDKYFSIAYQTGFGQVSLFYPDYIIKMKNNDIWIIETKGGEKSGNSQNIDKNSKIKFEAFKNYVIKRHPELKWGFVRNVGEEIYINNTEYTEKIIGSDKWENIRHYI